MKCAGVALYEAGHFRNTFYGINVVYASKCTNSFFLIEMCCQPPMIYRSDLRTISQRANGPASAEICANDQMRNARCHRYKIMMALSPFVQGSELHPDVTRRSGGLGDSHHRDNARERYRHRLADVCREFMTGHDLWTSLGTYVSLMIRSLLCPVRRLYFVSATNTILAMRLSDYSDICLPNKLAFQHVEKRLRSLNKCRNNQTFV